MEEVGIGRKVGRWISIFAVSILFAYIVMLVGMKLWYGSQTMPKVTEPFAGPAVGAGVPDCLRTSADAAQLYALVSAKPQTTETGPDDLRELTLILSKVACFKKDLLGAGGVVEATRYQPFATSHDMEPVAETTARCFAKTVPKRDLELAIDKWNQRAVFLIKRLCTSENMTEAEEMRAQELLRNVMLDIADVAFGRCCDGEAQIVGAAATTGVRGYEPPTAQDLRPYTGYY